MDTKENKKEDTVLRMTRRTWLQGAAGMLATIGLLGWSQGSLAASQGKKVLVVYYSRTGNTRAVARNIQAQVGGDLVEIQTVHPYPEEYRATTEQAKKELAEGYKPALTTRIENISEYTHIFVGSPNWWSTIAPPVMTLLSSYDLSGKTIMPFITHEGSALGRSVEDITKLCPQAKVQEGLPIRGRNAADSKELVAAGIERVFD